MFGAIVEMQFPCGVCLGMCIGAVAGSSSQSLKRMSNLEHNKNVKKHLKHKNSLEYSEPEYAEAFSEAAACVTEHGHRMTVKVYVTGSGETCAP